MMVAESMASLRIPVVHHPHASYNIKQLTECQCYYLLNKKAKTDFSCLCHLTHVQMLYYFLSIILKLLIKLTSQQFAVLNFSSEELPIALGGVVLHEGEL